MAEKKEFIRIRGARENNLKALNVDIPRNQFVVFTGLSGSGKSSLAFDTIYAEGQRRYMESLSSYARQFLGQMEKPNVDSIEGLPPAISIDQKSTNRNPRSTVGTVTEIYDYFRLLYARIGIPHCPKCGKVISRQSVDQMVDQIMALPERTKIQLLAPVVRGRKGRHEKVLEQAKRSGYVRVMIDGSQYELSEEITLDKNLKHNISIIVDRLVVKPDIEKRLTDSVENVLDLADGLLVVDTMDGNQLNFSQSFSCPDCGISMEEIEPRSFSFNNPFGACPSCAGLGYKMEFDEDLMIPDKTVSIADGAITVLGWQSCTDKSSYTRAVLDALAEEYDFSLSTPFCEYPKKIHDILIYGTNGKSVKVHYRGQRGVGVYDVAFEGLIKNVERRYRETGSDSTKQEYETFMRVTPCQACHGQRLKPTSLGVTVGDKNIFEVTSLSIDNLQKFMQNPYMHALQVCFTIILPMIMVGSLASLVNTFRNFAPWLPDLSLINSFSFGLISIFMAFLIPYTIMESKKLQKQKMITGFASVSALIALANPQYVDGNLVINSGYVGTGGMTVAMVMGLVIGWLFSAYFKHGLFKKDSSLPSVVVVWFESILIIFVLILVCIIIGQNVDLFSLLEKVFSPLAAIGNTYLGFLLFYMIMALCYCCGLSAWTVWPIVCALYLTNIAANAAAVAAGQAPIYIATDELVFMGWCCLGGLGCTLPLNILMIRSRSKKISTIGKAAIASSIFNINEPVMYGLPVVLNPVMMLGYMTVSFVVPTITYIVFKLGLVSIPAVAMMMNFLPQPISTFMVNSDFRGIILWAVLFVLTYLIYLPFFKVYEKQELESEQEVNALRKEEKNG